MNVRKVKIDTVENWEKNPRGCKKEGFERLKKQIVKLGIYKPLIVYYDGKKEKFISLGGNMRLRALRELKHNLIDISIIEPKNEAEKLEYALSDNDRIGYYEDDKLAELVNQHKNNIEMGIYKVDTKDSRTLTDILESFGIEDLKVGDPEIVFSEELKEEHNYIVLYFDNSVDWLQLLSLYKLLPKKALDSKKGFRKIGIGRVIKGSEFLNHILKDKNK